MSVFISCCFILLLHCSSEGNSVLILHILYFTLQIQISNTKYLLNMMYYYQWCNVTEYIYSSTVLYIDILSILCYCILLFSHNLEGNILLFTYIYLTFIILTSYFHIKKNGMLLSTFTQALNLCTILMYLVFPFYATDTDTSTR